MTFDEWWEDFVAEHEEWKYADSAALRRAAFAAGAASRDAEVAELQKAIDENWVTHQQIVAASKERDQLREHVTMLRDALLTCSVGDFSTGHVIHPSFDEKLVDEALAATEPKL